MTALKRKKKKDIVNWNDNSIRLYNVKSISLIRDDSIFKINTRLFKINRCNIMTTIYPLYNVTIEYVRT